MGRLVLIRHCQTDSNASGIVQGSRDLPLSSRGQRQAALVGAHATKNYVIDRVITSDRSRCVETAQAITDTAIQTPLLRELNFGDWEGQKWSQISSDYPNDIERLWNMDPSFAPPGGELVSSLIDRLDKVVVEYDLINSTGTTAVVAHDGILRSLIALILGWQTTNTNNMTLFNGSISEIFVRDGVATLDMLNYYEHLAPTYEESNVK